MPAIEGDGVLVDRIDNDVAARDNFDGTDGTTEGVDEELTA